VELRDRSGRIERLEIPGAVAALAGGPSRIFVAWADGFDHSLGWLGGGPAVSAPFGQGPPELAAVGDRLLVVRQQGGEVRGWLLAPDLRSYAATYEAGALGSAHEAERASTAIATDGTMAMLRSGSDGTTLIVLSCP
ncbi:MAG: hypothetical protein K8H88_04620, partial [Sandaracinaceae bacterium]|nr:hypothetical protein [Sandaracinaceae bacterium]